MAVAGSQSAVLESVGRQFMNGQGHDFRGFRRQRDPRTLDFVSGVGSALRCDFFLQDKAQIDAFGRAARQQALCTSDRGKSAVQQFGVVCDGLGASRGASGHRKHDGHDVADAMLQFGEQNRLAFGEQPRVGDV